MPSIPDNFIDELVARVDLHDLLGRYITLKKSGSRWMGVCPFHGDSNPSLSVNPDKGFWYCFGCQTGGDAITFIRKQENLEFVEAVKFIAQIYGIPIPETTSDPKAARRRTLIDINDRAREFFIKVLKSKYGKPIRDYLADRGFKRDTVVAYRVGASLDGWEHLKKYLIKKGFNEQDIIDAGVAIPGKSGRGAYDRFRGRLMIPIIDPLDRTLGFGARAMGDDEPKYINSPESPSFQKSKVLFGLDLAKKACRDSGQLVIMEGYTDVMQAHQAGVLNCCAVMGTALTNKHLPLLARYAGEVVLAFDGDEAGMRATTKSLMAFAGSDFSVKVLPLPEGSDPADIIRSEGEKAFRGRLAEAVDGSMWLFKTYGQAVRDSDINSRLKAFEEIAPYVEAFRTHPVYDEIQEHAAIAFNLNLSALRSVLKQVRVGRKITGDKVPENVGFIVRESEEAERVFFLSLMANSRYLVEIKELLSQDDFDFPIHRRLARIFFQPGFTLNIMDNLTGLREISEDDELHSYVVRLVMEHEEDMAGDSPRYTEDELKKSLLHLLKRQFQTECTRLQTEMQACKTDLESGSSSTETPIKNKFADLQKERQELEDNYRGICYQLGGEKVSRKAESEVEG